VANLLRFAGRSVVSSEIPDCSTRPRVIVEHTAQMRRPVVFALFLMVTACGGGSGTPDAVVVPPADAEIVPAFRNPVDLPDDELALQALQILGADVEGHDERCNGCHPLTKQHIRYWATLSDVAMADCFTDLGITSVDSAHGTIDCWRIKPSNPTATFDTPKLGVFAAGARLPWFQYLFTKAYNGSTTEYEQFVQRSAMPPSGGREVEMTQAQFDVVAEWFIRGIPNLEELLPEDPPPTECFPSVGTRVIEHVAAMATEGWAAHNLAQGMSMYGCAGASTPADCLASKPLASSTTFGADWDIAGRGTSRVLYQFVNEYSSDYWTRSSADGRFVAHGGGQPGFPSTVLDLQENSLINLNAAYDPAFFPDNSGFVFQNAPNNVCPQSVLVAAGTNVSMNEAGCTDLGAVGLYEHVGAAIGGDYFAVSGEFVSDNGGHAVTLRDPQSNFGQDGSVRITPMVYNGSSFSTKPSVNVAVPFEGDAVLSPTSKLMVNRLSGPSGRQLGFVLRAVDATPSGSSYDIDAPEIGRYCFTGGKPAFSYDERWMIIHHYISPNSDEDAQELGFTGADDPGYTSQPTTATSYTARGTANVFLVDLVTGEKTRLTNMKPGQYALYPHFRSDGWIYYQVRDIGGPGSGDETEYAVASNAAFVLD
jgi:hypothetical protein